MTSDSTSSPDMEGEKIRSALEAVRISSDLIAFYPQPLRRTQPYVILLNPASGIFKRLDLGDAKQGFCSTSQRLVA